MDNKANEKHFGLRVDGSHSCEVPAMSAASMAVRERPVIQLMLKFIADYEAEHGKIELEK